MPTRKQLENARLQADQLGDTQASQVFADMIQKGEFDTSTGPENPTSKTESFAAGATQGATLDFGDEIYGATHAALGKIPGGRAVLNKLMGLPGDYAPVELTDSAQQRADQMGMNTPDSIYSYTGLRDRARGAFNNAYESNPKTYLGGAVASGLPLGFAGGAKAAAGQTFRQAIPRLAGTGAAFGGTAGLGASESDTIPGMLGDTAVGAGAGALVGVALPAAARGVAKGVKGLVDVLNPVARGAKIVTKDLADVGLTPQQAQKILKSNPDFIPADLGESLQQRLGAVANAPGATPQAARTLLEARNAQQLPRMNRLFTSALNDTPVMDAADAAVARTRTAAGPLYDAAYETVIPPTAQKAIRRLMKRPSVKAAMHRAGILAAEQEKDIDLSGPLNMRTVDYIQRGMRMNAEKVSKNSKEFAKYISNSRRDLLKIADGVSPDFKAARKIAADEFSNVEALEMGKKVFTETTPSLRRLTRDWSESEREHFRIGVFEKIADIMASKPPDAELTRIFSSDKRKAAIKLAFNDDKLYQKFVQMLKSEQTMEQTARKGLKGSPTGSRQAYGQSELPITLTQLFTKAIQKGIAKYGARPVARVNDTTGKLLLDRNILQGLDRTAPKPLAPWQPNVYGALSSPMAVDPQRQLDALVGR